MRTRGLCNGDWIREGALCPRARASPWLSPCVRAVSQRAASISRPSRAPPRAPAAACGEASALPPVAASAAASAAIAAAAAPPPPRAPPPPPAPPPRARRRAAATAAAAAAAGVRVRARRRERGERSHRRAHPRALAFPDYMVSNVVLDPRAARSPRSRGRAAASPRARARARAARRGSRTGHGVPSLSPSGRATLAAHALAELRLWRALVAARSLRARGGSRCRARCRWGAQARRAGARQPRRGMG